MFFSARKSAAVLAFVPLIILPLPAFAEPPTPPPTTTNIVDYAYSSLQAEALSQQQKVHEEQLAAEKAAAEKAAAEKAAAEKAAAEKALAERKSFIKEKLALTEEQFTLLTEADLQNLNAEPCSLDGDREYSNGQLPSGALCSIGEDNHRLRPQASVAFHALSVAFERDFGKPLCITDSYRTLEEQQRLKAEKPTLAAKPGTSNHGWGLAVDLCGGVNEFGSKEHEWLRQHGPSFGWHHPQWARSNGSKPEPWHWEYVAVENANVPL